LAFPESLLTEDEEVVEHLHPHWVTLVPAVASFLVICAFTGVAVALLPTGAGEQRPRSLLLWAIVAVAFVALCWWTVAPLLRWRSQHYVITTHRVLIRRGILRHSGRDIPLARINDVAFEQTLFDRIVRAGSLTIESAGERGQETLVDLPRADTVQQTLNRLVENAAVRRSRREGW
jgi:uncharacterized membrane protein YdbT with pleckstrin-like domain